MSKLKISPLSVLFLLLIFGSSLLILNSCTRRATGPQESETAVIYKVLLTVDSQEVYDTLIQIRLDSLITIKAYINIANSNILFDSVYIFDTTVIRDSLYKFDTTVVRDSSFVYDTTYIYDTTVVRDSSFVYDTSYVYDTTYKYDTTFVFDTLTVYDSVFVFHTAYEYDSTYIFDTVVVFDSLFIRDSLYKFDTALIFDTLHIIDTLRNYDTTYRFDTVYHYDTVYHFDTVSSFDTVRTFDTVRSFDTVRYYDTVHVIDTIFAYDTIGTEKVKPRIIWVNVPRGGSGENTRHVIDDGFKLQYNKAINQYALAGNVVSLVTTDGATLKNGKWSSASEYSCVISGISRWKAGNVYQFVIDSADIIDINGLKPSAPDTVKITPEPFLRLIGVDVTDQYGSYSITCSTAYCNLPDTASYTNPLQPPGGSLVFRCIFNSPAAGDTLNNHLSVDPTGGLYGIWAQPGVTKDTLNVTVGGEVLPSSTTFVIKIGKDASDSSSVKMEKDQFIRFRTMDPN
ncbi:MAG: hypothetical protein ABIA63_13925 [bacterium]